MSIFCYIKLIGIDDVSPETPAETAVQETAILETATLVMMGLVSMEGMGNIKTVLDFITSTSFQPSILITNQLMYIYSLFRILTIDTISFH